jgi:uncharacterized membrane protein YfcA
MISKPLLNYSISFIIGLLAGTFGGLVGLGGGVIMIPLMVGILKLKQHLAHGTSLLVVVFTGLSGAIAYGMNGSVDVIASLSLAVTAIVTARAGVHLAHSLPEWKLKRFFGCFLIFVSILMLSKSYFLNMHATGEGLLKIIILLLTGAFTGFLSGMMGVGGGTIMVPVMVLFAGLSQHMAQGSSLLAMIPTGAVGAYTHWQLGNVSVKLLPWLIPGILIGTYLGGTFAHVLPESILRIIFVVVLIWTGLRYIRTNRPSVKAE